MDEESKVEAHNKFKPLCAKLHSQHAIAVVLSYYGGFLEVTKVLLQQLNKNSRRYTVSQLEQLRAFCKPDPTREVKLFNMTYELSDTDENSMYRTTYAADRYNKLKKSLTFRDGEDQIDKTAELGPGQRLELEFDIPEIFTSLEQVYGMVQVVFRNNHYGVKQFDIVLNIDGKSIGSFNQKVSDAMQKKKFNTTFKKTDHVFEMVNNHTQGKVMVEYIAISVRVPVVRGFNAVRYY